MRASRSSAVRYLMAVAVVSMAVQACNTVEEDSPSEQAPHGRGAIVQSTILGTVTPANIQQFLTAANVEIPFALVYSVDVISTTYLTVNANGNEATVSGALFFPQGANDLPIVSIQHGTQTRADLVASVSPANSTEGIVGLIMASMGYLVVIPDYPGFGVSRLMHPYHHAESLVPCVIDLMRVGRSYASAGHLSLSGHVFLTGYSEGGYVTLVAQKEIEEHYASEFSLTAVAPLAGAYDLEGTVRASFEAGSYASPAYAAFLFTAYNEVYGWDRLDEFFNAPYASMMPDLFDGSKTWGEIGNQLPSTFSALMNPAFVADYLSGKEQDVEAALRENTRLDWVPQAPIHFFHGDADDIVPYQNALTAVDAFTSRGASNIQLTAIPGGTHESSGQPALIGAIQWFESIEASSRMVVLVDIARP